MNPEKSTLTKFWEITALDWIPILLCITSIPSNKSKFKKIEEELKANYKIQLLNKSLEQLYTITMEITQGLESQEKRRLQIESKATNLLGFTVLASTFTLSFIQFLSQKSNLPSIIYILITILYTIIAISLLITVILARNAVVTTSFYVVEAKDIIELTYTNQYLLYRDRAVKSILALDHNKNVVDDKGTYLSGAQDWFRNTVLLLLLLIIILGCSFIYSSSNNSQTKANDVLYVVVLTPTSNQSPVPYPTNTLVTSSTLIPSIAYPIPTGTVSPTMPVIQPSIPTLQTPTP